MTRIEHKQVRRIRRKRRVRKSVMGTPDRPRLTVFRSLKHIYAQVVNDLEGTTIASASTKEKSSAGKGNCSGAEAVGKVLAERAKGAGVKRVVFDRNGYRYHGRIAALAKAAREGGLDF
jgi:large subunit ribosomal protein L18